MSDAAQGEPRSHEVFRAPFKVEPVYESKATPPNYRRYPGGKQLPDHIKVWRVQNSGKSYGSVVSASFGFEDSPDAEILTPGFNEGKESGAVGVGRHGNFLQWGFSCAPSQMTEAGRCFFLNCVCYIRKFDGKAPLVRVRANDRTYAVFLASLLNTIKDPRFATNTFAPELLSKYNSDPDGLSKHYANHLELVYRDKVFRVDDELAGLGVASNRRTETLQRLAELLDDPARATAAHNALKRYTSESFSTRAEWQAWLDKNRGRIFFSDIGGYKFFVTPEGYAQSEAAPVAAPAR